MDKIEITFKTITPMFMRGASEEPELRAPSIKGVLRFWYRAIYANYTYDEENRIFGSAQRGYGQSLVVIRVSPQKVPNSTTYSQHEYLAYGVVGKNERKCIPPGRQFKLQLIFKKSINEDEKLRVKRSLWAMFIFGGFGAKSRKGFGSVAVVKATNMDELPSFNFNENGKAIHATQIKSFMKDIERSSLSLPEHSCWSEKTRCVLTYPEKTPELSLTTVEKTLKDSRLRIGNDFKSAIASADNATMKDLAVNNNIPTEAPKRAYFGLPHNILFSVENDPEIHVEVNYKDENKKDIRRASPLFISIIQISKNQYCAIITFLYSRFIPKGKKITITAFSKDDDGNKTGEVSHKVDSTDDYQLVEKVVNQFAKQNGAEDIS